MITRALVALAGQWPGLKPGRALSGFDAVGQPVATCDRLEDVGPDGAPWWQTAKTPNQGFILAGLWFFLGLLQVVAAIGDPRAWSFIFAGMTTLLALGYLIPALLLRKRQRERSDARD